MKEMICRKCFHMWFNELPIPKILVCPKCGEPVTIEYLHQPESPIDSSIIKDIIIEDCFHLKDSKGQLVLYGYSENTLAYLMGLGYEKLKTEDHVMFLRKKIVIKNVN